MAFLEIYSDCTTCHRRNCKLPLPDFREAFLDTAQPCLVRTEFSWGPTVSDTNFPCYQLALCIRNNRSPFPDECSVPHRALPVH